MKLLRQIVIREARKTLKNEGVTVDNTSVPVLVLYTYHYGQLGVLRSLGRLGIATNGVDPNPWSPACFLDIVRKNSYMM